jgi:putative tryptophan/tyrosine transport system substrate-binding protein
VIKAVRVICTTVLLAATALASADENRRLPTIGLAVPVDPGSDAPYQQAFRDGLRELGWVDGKNVSLITRYSYGDPAKYREIIRELITLRVDVLWGEARELKEETSTIPIVSPTMGFGDPVRMGLVESLSRPGGNLTGPSSQRHDIDPKLLQLTKELLPGLKRLCLLYDGRPERNLIDYANKEFRALAREYGINVCMIPIRTQEDVEAVPGIIDQQRPQAAIIWISEFMYQRHVALVSPIAHRLPVIGDLKELAVAGAVLIYSVDHVHMFKRSALYVDKILKGAKPGDLPIEQPTRFKLVVNLKTADALGIKVPQSILVLADEIIR